MDIRDQKRTLRRTILARRARLSPDERLTAAVRASDRLLGLPEIAAAKAVMAFAAFGSEIPTDPLVTALLSSGKRVLMPLVDGERMRAAEIFSLADLAPGYHGILEPPLPVAIPPDAGVVVVPGVAFDPAGRRLGYGGGFYDEFLAATTGLRAGYCFDCQIVDAIPSERHDETVAIVVTEARVIRAGGA